MKLFLIGFMAAGKTSVGRALAATTGRAFVDLDDAITALGEPTAELVARDEAEFRRREAQVLAQLATDAKPMVIATGGGAAAHGDNLERMRAAGLVVALGVDVAEAHQRASGQGGVTGRPNLAKAAELAAHRAPIYRRAHAVVDTMGRSVDAVLADVRAVEAVWTGLQRTAAGAAPTILALGDRSYPITVDDRLPIDIVRAQVAGATKLCIITDSNVAAHHLVATRNVLGAPAEVIELPPGEASKSFAMFEEVANSLVGLGLDRSSVIVALGGGVVGDLAGFVAATYMRGIPIIQLPTTLVAMTDAAIGGKTAIDTPAGKNLVGAFWQPRLVACATSMLTTLPGRERRAGFGELWKYALLDGADLWRAVAACAPWAAGPEGTEPPPELRLVIDRAIAYKAAVVSRDERERSGHRALLNLGHTIGHAIESASGLLHGEAVGLGLVAAARVSAAVVGTRPELVREICAALDATGLPSDVEPYLSDDVLDRVGVDKKRQGADLRFIVVRDVGNCDPVAIGVTELRRILRPESRG